MEGIIVELMRLILGLRTIPAKAHLVLMSIWIEDLQRDHSNDK